VWSIAADWGIKAREELIIFHGEKRIGVHVSQKNERKPMSAFTVSMKRLTNINKIEGK
jgi:hypothetical protein